jgi:hypothetical protein
MWPFDRARKKREFIQSLGKLPFTPDLPELEQTSHRLLFVCDDMKIAHQKHRIIKEHSVRVTRAFTQDRFDLRVGRHTGKALPILNKDGLRIKGEVHAVESQYFKALDEHYRNGVEFARVKLKVITVDRDHQLVDIGNERHLQHLPPGVIRTVPELGLRHYLSNRHVHLVTVRMYVALQAFWLDGDVDNSFPIIQSQFPAEPLVWLPKYYKYPIERNRNSSVP